MSSAHPGWEVMEPTLRVRDRSPTPASGRAPRWAAVLLLLWAAFPVASEAWREQGPERRAGVPEARIDPEGFTSARECGVCHEDIYESWKRSLHALSLQDPIFDVAFMQALKRIGDEARTVCLPCHAPMTLANGDFDLSEGVTREGVSCDFCHTVTAVHIGEEGRPYSNDVGLVKRSVLRKAESPAHEVAYSELHGTSEFCAGCHNYVGESGVTLLGTYDEWRSGPYAAEGVQCQDCHMAPSPGDLVRPEVKESRHEIHRHQLIHDSEQVRGALRVEIGSVQRASRRLVVDVVVENVGSGHMVPTGIPSRLVVLEVTAEGRGFSRSGQRRYRKIVADGDGRVLDRDFEILLFGAQILNDTRIAPRERRLERFTFDVRESGRVDVSASLSYRYSVPIVRDETLEITLGEAKRIVY